MTRTQIYLDEELHKELRLQSKIQKKKISQIIREILRENLLSDKRSIRSMKEIAGLWKDRDIDPEKYVRDLRKGTRFERIYG